MYLFVYLSLIILLSRSSLFIETAEKKLTEPVDFDAEPEIQDLSKSHSNEKVSKNEKDHNIEHIIDHKIDHKIGATKESNVNNENYYDIYDEDDNYEDNPKSGKNHPSYQDIYAPNRFEELKYSNDFTDKVILITGSSSGLGAEMARAFSSLGAKLVITGRNGTRLKQVAQDVYRLSPYKLKPLAVEADLLVSDDLNRLFYTTMRTYKKLDVLINNAGIYLEQNILDKSFVRGLDQIIRTNLRVPLKLTQLAAPYLNMTRGNIINMAGFVGFRAVEKLPGYATMKAALIMATQTLALELAPNVRVNSISPGVVIGTLLYGPYDLPPEEQERVRKLTPLARNEIPLDVAKGAVFLASSDADFITGYNLVIDGGVNMNYPGSDQS